jgi:hypothetical protein
MRTPTYQPNQRNLRETNHADLLIIARYILHQREIIQNRTVESADCPLTSSRLTDHWRQFYMYHLSTTIYEHGRSLLAIP